MSWAAAKPAAIDPSEMPLATNMTIDARRFFGAYSDASPIAFGSAAPSPRPVKNRSTRSSVRLPISTVASVQKPNAMQDQMMTRRRPMRSASGASSSAPSITPNRPALNVGPSAPRCRLQASTDRGRDVGDALHVEAVDEQNGAAEQEGPQLQARRLSGRR